MAKKKFDTNPLDPDFPKKVGAEQAGAETRTLPRTGADTREFADPADTEEQTRRFGEGDFNAYQSPYNGQNIPAGYGSGRLYPENSHKRKVERIGLPENILTALPYLPVWIGFVAGFLILLFLPKSEAKVRFHAAQGVAAQIGILIVTTILSSIGKVTDLADIGNWIFQIVTTIMLIVFAVKAYQGKPIHIESVEELTEWLEDKIKPKS